MLLASSGVSGSTSKMYVDDVFSVQLRTGNGTSQSVTTGFQPDLIWTKSRSAATGHRLVDSARGAGNSLESNSTLSQQSEATGITAFSSSGYSIGTDLDYNTNAATYVDWCWKKAPKFFDVVTYTGNGASNRQIPHSLGAAPGMVIIRRLDVDVNWYVYSSAAAAGTMGMLNSTNGFSTSQAGFTYTDTFGTIPFSSSTFTVSNGGGHVNASNGLYVAYLFAHDPSADGIIQCGSYVGNAGNNVEVELGWEPQFLLVKGANSADNWRMIDVMRGWSQTGESFLGANSSSQEFSNTNPLFKPKATGFTVTSASTMYNDTGYNFIYLAIRRPNKPPTTGAEVYKPLVWSSTNSLTQISGVGFAPDFVVTGWRNTGGLISFDKLRGAKKRLDFYTTGEEQTSSDALIGFLNDGVLVDADSTSVHINYSWREYSINFFRRAPGFLSSFAYTGTGSNTTQSHDLAAIPDLLIVKSRSAATDWQVWCNGLAANEKLVLNSNAGKVTDATAWNSTLPTSTNISLGTASATNANTATFIAYAFSNLPGIQKIGTYVGDGTSGRVIDCGFSTGARFVCIKAISTTGSWLVADSARGIVSGNDPYLQLNSTAAEVTTEDWLDPASVGFIVNNVASSNANTNGVTYMYWAIS